MTRRRPPAGYVDAGRRFAQRQVRARHDGGSDGWPGLASISASRQDWMH
ncbi:hypothetical protein ACTJKF_14250 [Burkholderia sp. 22313]